MFDNFFFVALPYIAILLFIGGSAYRAFTGVKTAFRGRLAWSARGDLLWTTRSTGFFGRASIGTAALGLHWGLIILVVAHVVGFIGGAGNWPSLVNFFRWAGMFGGMLFLYGVFWAFVRRLTIPQLRAMSTPQDYILLLFLIIILGLGLYHSAIQLAFGVSYAVGPWFVSIFTLQPDAGLVAGAPFVVKLHMIVNFIFLAYFPSTKLVHAFSYPFAYITRPYISMRSYVGLKR
ncbi:MAG: respiratory nitrate reductase subunit gamma [Chloroflexi bacterium]|nr:respiratory nitrate reductase subunit gamma [Chloroflexota bacterium]